MGVLVFSAILLIGGCVRPWAPQFIHQSAHYVVFSDDGPATAAALAEVAESSFAHYRELLGPVADPTPKFRINAYADRRNYRAAARRFGIAAASTGLYSPETPAAVHLPARFPLDETEADTLRHEGLHQFVDRFYSREVFVTDSHGQNPPTRLRLSALPLWLNEGLAVAMEGYESQRRRLKHLQRLVDTGRGKSLQDLLARRYGEAFSADDYTLAWGVAHFLVEYRPQKLRRYLQALHDDLFALSEAELFRLLGESKEPPRCWYDRLSRQGVVEFERIVLESRQTLTEWENNWHRAVGREGFLP